MLNTRDTLLAITVTVPFTVKLTGSSISSCQQVRLSGASLPEAKA